MVVSLITPCCLKNVNRTIALKRSSWIEFQLFWECNRKVGSSWCIDVECDRKCINTWCTVLDTTTLNKRERKLRWVDVQGKRFITWIHRVFKITETVKNLHCEWICRGTVKRIHNLTNKEWKASPNKILRSKSLSYYKIRTVFKTSWLKWTGNLIRKA